MRTLFFPIICVSLLLAAVAVHADDGDVRSLIADVASQDKDVCLEAVDALALLGAEAEAAVPALVEALQREDSEICWRVCRSLGVIGENAKSAVSALTKSLKHEDGNVRAYAAFALGQIGKPASPAVDILIENAFDTNELVRRASLRALRKIDPPQEKTMPLVLDILEREDLSIIMPALHTLAMEGKSEVPRLQKALKNERARYWACLVLAEIGPDAAVAVPDLAAVLQDEDAEVRLHALLALGEIGEAAKPAVPAILEAFEKSEYGATRHAAVYALGKIRVTGPDAGVLRQSLKSDDDLLRTLAAWALARSHPDDKELVGRAVRLIVDAFKSEDASVRQAAARAVVEFDVEHELVAPVLVDALNDEDDTVVANAISALAAFGPRALRHVDDALQNDELRHYAVLLIARVGPEATSAVPALIEVLKQKPEDEDDEEFIREAQFALSAIGPGARDAIPALLDSLSSTNDEIRASASYALGKMGPAARAAVPALRQALRSDSFIVKLASVRALLEIQPNQRQLGIVAIPLLSKALDHEQEMVRAEAASALGDLGTLGKRAIPRLKELLDDESEIVRDAAAAALKKLAG